MEKIEWKSPQHIYTEKTTDWYWIVGIISVTIALISIILNNVIFAILVIVSSFTLSLFASKKPETISNEINQKGIKKGSVFYHYEDIDSFWIETEDRYPRIILKLKSKLSQLLIILINVEDTEKIRDFLNDYIKEEKMSESIFEKLFIYFGF